MELGYTEYKVSVETGVYGLTTTGFSEVFQSEILVQECIHQLFNELDDKIGFVSWEEKQAGRTLMMEAVKKPLKSYSVQLHLVNEVPTVIYLHTQHVDVKEVIVNSIKNLYSLSTCNLKASMMENRVN